jgi:hypothetical protein
VGRRCGRIGLVVELGQVLLQATDAANADMYNAPVHQLLQVRPAPYMQPQGILPTGLCATLDVHAVIAAPILCL